MKSSPVRVVRGIRVVRVPVFIRRGVARGMTIYYENQVEMDQMIHQQESFVATLRLRTPSKLAPRLVSAAQE